MTKQERVNELMRQIASLNTSIRVCTNEVEKAQLKAKRSDLKQQLSSMLDATKRNRISGLTMIN